jgi:hypothetical protein
MLQLFLNDTLVDLTDDSPIALTFQINNLAEVKNQQGNTSNQFKLPLTQRNRQILGYPDDVAFTTNQPYKQYAAKLVQDGMEIVPYGIGELNSVDDSTASITILSGNVDFFDAIDGKIYDMGDTTTELGKLELWKPYEHAWTLDNVVASQQHTYQNGWIWPVVDYGNIDSKFDGQPTIDVRYLRPGFFLRKAIDVMLKPGGYTLNPDSFLLKDELYNKLIIQFANDNFEHGPAYDNSNSNYSLVAKSTILQGYKHERNGANEDLRFGKLDKGSSRIYDYAASAYKATAELDVTVTLQYGIFYQSEKPDAAVTISIKMFDPANGQTTSLASIRHGSNTVPKDGRFYQGEISGQVITANTSLNVGQAVKISYDVDQAVKRYVYFHMHPGATFTVTDKLGNVLYGQQVQAERILPDIGIKDVLKDTLQRFGIICQTDNTRRMVTLASLRNLVNNIPQAKDWTTKCLNQGKNITFQLGGYAQTNILKYKEDDNVLPLNLADGQITVDDKTLPASGTLFESQFAPTLNRPYIGGTIAQINKVEPGSGSTDYSVSTQPRLLIHDVVDLRRLDRSIRFIDGLGTERIVNDVICTPYFDKPGGAHSLLFDKLRQQYYPELERILKQSKKVVRWFMLTPRDILELDLLIPVYLQQDGAYYYINKIDSWRKGQPVKVELVKLG